VNNEGLRSVPTHKIGGGSSGFGQNQPKEGLSAFNEEIGSLTHFSKHHLLFKNLRIIGPI
jgi:hypothetical protein